MFLNFFKKTTPEKIKKTQKYGVDPSNPKIDEVDGYLIPVQEAKKLAFLSMVRERE